MIVEILLLARNEKANLRECLQSLARAPHPDLRITVVDNQSTDSSQEMIRREFPHVVLIENGANLGYAAGNNVGLHHAVDQGADYVLVLNCDTVVAPDCVAALVEALEREPRAAFAGPMVYHFDEPQVIQSAGGVRTKGWRFHHRGQNETDWGQYANVDAVVWVTGCAILVRAAALTDIGLLDAAFFIYNEEVDWCVRAGLAGWKVLFVPSAKIWHKGVRRHYDPSPRVTYLSVRNELLLLQKHRAGTLALGKALARHLRTLASWSVRPKWRDRRPQRKALAWALRDFVQHRYGPPPAEL